MSRKSLSLALLLGASLFFGACSDEPALIIDRKSFDFGELEVGTSTVEQLFTVRNASPHDVASVGVSVEGSDSFSITANTCEKYLAAGMECEVRVKFAPLLGGTHSASLKLAGAPSVEQTELQGAAFAWVDVPSIPPGTRIVAGDDSFTCTQPCRHAVRKAELTLYVSPEGFPTWGAACANAPRSGCLLRMDASKSVALEWLPLYQWEVRRSLPPVMVAPLANGNIVVQDSMGVTSLDAAGLERWSLPLTGTAKLVVTSDWYISLLRYDGTVTQYDSDGRLRWTYSPQGPRSGEYIEADAIGNTYVLLTQGSDATAVVMRLIALSREGVELWSTVINEGQFNDPLGLGVMSDGRYVYVVGTVYKPGATPQERIFEKGFSRKLTPAGVPLWTKEGFWGGVSFTHSGEMILVASDFLSAPGGVMATWIDSDGKMLWSSQTSPEKGPGVVDTYAFPPSFTSVPRLLFGGHEQLPGTDTYGRGWFADMGDRSKLAPGSITYIDSPYRKGAWVSSLVYTVPARQVVVGGGFGSRSNPEEGFIRLYDPRTLTMER